MSKIGIVTLFHDNYNYGAALQAFALQKAIEKLGHEACIIDYKRCIEPIPDDDSFESKKSFAEKLHIKTKGDFINICLYPFTRKYGDRLLENRKIKFKKFYERNLNVSRLYDIATIYSANEEFDAFICGSDQIWRPSSYDPNFFLDFADKIKLRISYAASMGVKILSENSKKVMVPLIDGLTYISVREEEAKSALKDKCNSDIQVVLDPTLLWGEDFWKKYSKLPSGIAKGKYIFCYLIGENNANRDLAKYFARNMNLPLITIPGVSRVQAYDFMYADMNLTEAGPEEFLGLIQNAALIITDSFHACVFSIIFHKKFYAVERFDKNDANSMNGRIYDLLNLFGLEKQLISSKDESTEQKECVSNMMKYNEKLSFSWSYLKNALENVGYVQPAHSYKLPHTYACQSLSLDVRMKSSSGGIFYHLAQRTIDKGGKVIACRLDAHGVAKHNICNSMDEIEPFLTSKYVQSQIGEMYVEADKIIRQNIELLFVGTPCQIQGLLNYLSMKNTSTNNLVAVDFVCHGVPSPSVWSEYYAELKSCSDNENSTVNFRSKSKGWKNSSLRVESCNTIREAAKPLYESDKESDMYIRGFLNNLFLRPSCYNCRFKSIIHSSDLTLGDFWHYENCQADLIDDDTGISLVVAQSKRGYDVINELDSIDTQEVPCSVISYANKNMLRSAHWNKKRESFFDNYNKYKQTYCGKQPMITYLNICMKDSTRTKLKKILKKVVRG